MDGVEIPLITVQPKQAVNLLSELALALRTAQQEVQVHQERVRVGNVVRVSVHVLQMSAVRLLGFVERVPVNNPCLITFHPEFS